MSDTKGIGGQPVGQRPVAHQVLDHVRSEIELAQAVLARCEQMASKPTEIISAQDPDHLVAAARQGDGPALHRLIELLDANSFGLSLAVVSSAT